eukprot:312026-Rhodomonas_salina.1
MLEALLNHVFAGFTGRSPKTAVISQPSGGVHERPGRIAAQPQASTNQPQENHTSHPSQATPCSFQQDTRENPRRQGCSGQCQEKT